MCRKKMKINNTDAPLEGISRDIYYSTMTKSISDYIKRTNKIKIAFQIIFGVITSLVVVGITVLFILLVFYIVTKKASGSLDSNTALATIISSSVTYAASLIGTLAIVMNYMFNRNDMADNSDLIKSFILSDSAKEIKIVGQKSVDKIVENAGIHDALMNEISQNDTDVDANK